MGDTFYYAFLCDPSLVDDKSLKEKYNKNIKIMTSLKKVKNIKIISVTQ